MTSCNKEGGGAPEIIIFIKHFMTKGGNLFIVAKNYKTWKQGGAFNYIYINTKEGDLQKK